MTVTDEIMKSADEIRRGLRDLIIFQLVPLEEHELSDDAPLVDDVLDSLGISEIAIFIEDEIGRPLHERARRMGRDGCPVDRLHCRPVDHARNR